MYCTYAVLCSRVISHPPPHPLPHQKGGGGGDKKYEKIKKIWTHPCLNKSIYTSETNILSNSCITPTTL